MNDSGIKAVAIKAVTAAGLFAAVWLLTVKPADASLRERNQLLEAQAHAINDYALRTRHEDTTAIALANLAAHAEHFADRLTRHPTDASIYDAIESAASANGVRVHRTEPRPAPRKPRSTKSSANPDPVGVTVAEFSVELSGSYGAVAAFLDTIGKTLGLARVVEVRLASSAGGQVRGVIALSVFRVPPSTKIVPETQEAGEDEA